MGKSRLFAIVLGLAGLVNSGCDKECNIEFISGKIENQQVKIVREVHNANVDNFSLEIYDKEGKIRAKLKQPSYAEGYIQFDDKKMIEFRGGQIIETESFYKGEAESPYKN